MERIVAKWTGEHFEALGQHHQRCRDTFEVGERVVIEVARQRSDASHKQYFAAIREAWMNLPEEAAARYDSPEKLRKWALIRCGYCEQHDFVMDSEERAIGLAMVMRKLDDYAAVVVRGNIVRIYRAKSQSLTAMGKDDFEASKRHVLDILSGQIGVNRTALEREGKLRTEG